MTKRPIASATNLPEGAFVVLVTGGDFDGRIGCVISSPAHLRRKGEVRVALRPLDGETFNTTVTVKAERLRRDHGDDV